MDIIEDVDSAIENIAIVTYEVQEVPFLRGRKVEVINIRTMVIVSFLTLNVISTKALVSEDRNNIFYDFHNLIARNIHVN